MTGQLTSSPTRLHGHYLSCCEGEDEVELRVDDHDVNNNINSYVSTWPAVGRRSQKELLAGHHVFDHSATVSLSEAARKAANEWIGLHLPQHAGTYKIEVSSMCQLLELRVFFLPFLVS